MRALLVTRPPGPLPDRHRRAPRVPWLSPLLGLALLAAAPAASAQVSAEDRVAAESLFGDARRAMLAGDYAQACPKLEASRRLEPAVGTTLNLADCYEKLGRTASAWAEFKSAAAEAQRLGDGLRKTTALERAAALEPRLSRLRVDVTDTSVAVFRDGEALSQALLGSAVPVDPGTIRLEARAPGKRTWRREIVVAGEGVQQTVQIPALEDEPLAAGATTAEPARVATEGGSGRTWAWVVGGVGAAALATGATLSLLASSNWSSAKDECGDLPYDCSPDAVSRADRASTQANVATAAFIVGGAALGASIILFSTSSEGAAATQLALTPSSVTLRGRW